MTDWTKSERVTTEVVYTVKAEEPWGADWNQVQQALNAAIRDLSELNGYSRVAVPSDDAIRVYAKDDVIEIVFEKPKPTGRANDHFAPNLVHDGS